jgi:hypothetical protein
LRSTSTFILGKSPTSVEYAERALGSGVNYRFIGELSITKSMKTLKKIKMLSK